MNPQISQMDADYFQNLVFIGENPRNLRTQ
jgi:hypothetical protein